MEIKKLTDILEWADGWIEGMKGGMTEEEFAVDEEVKAFEAVKKVVNETIEKHSVYTNALNKDIADKAAKIDLLEKEIEGRKEGYTALKELMDTKYISIEEYNKICKKAEDTIEYYEDEIKSLNDEVGRRRNAYLKDSEFIINIKKELEDWKERERTKSNMLRDAKAKIAELEKELADCKVKIRHQKENLDGINKTLEIRTKEKERLITVKNNQEKEIEAHEAENARLSEKIVSLKKENKMLDGIIKGYWDELKKKEDDHGRAGFKKYIEWLIEEEERAVPERFKARLNEEITAIFTKEEETEVKDAKEPIIFDEYHKYNWFPCGEDSIE